MKRDLVQRGLNFKTLPKGVKTRQRISMSLFSKLSKFLEKSSLSEKRKLLKLILSNNPILTADIRIGNIVNQPVSMVYNLKTVKDIKHNIDTQKRNTNDTYATGIIAQVTNIENKKGHMITKTSARNIFNFLMEFARFATANL